MTTTFQIIVKSDLAEATLAQEKLDLKGYQTTLTKTKNAVIDCRDLPDGVFKLLKEPDDEIYVVMGIK